jgi:hypothetical protein
LGKYNFSLFFDIKLNSYIKKITNMLNLLIAILLLCGTFGATISKTTKDYGFRKQREHTEPLKLD